MFNARHIIALLSALVLATQSVSAQAEYAKDCGLDVQTSFDVCISNSLLGGNRLLQPPGTSVVDACASAQQQSENYSCCLCAGYKTIMTCHTAACANSTNVPIVNGQMMAHCATCKASGSSIIASATIAGVPGTSLIGTVPAGIRGTRTLAPTATSSEAAAAAGSDTKPNSAAHMVPGFPVAAVAAVVGSLIMA
ncbi:hypothetical protein DFJ77DRAFT_461041 [Powellomyces hirtus]|nr:hypothetical protein DFJ77DRAFT_461041 [Powellomyces hirtus]